MVTVYGIPNCNTVKKALDWLRKHQVDFVFHDYKKKGITEEKLQQWCSQFTWQALVNKAGTTWKTLSEAEKEAITTEQSAIKLMLDKTSIIKRPIIETTDTHLLGFDETKYNAAFATIEKF